MVIPIFLSVVLAVFTGGTAYSRKIAIVEAVREGSRFGASLPLGTGMTALTDWEEAVRSRVIDASTGELSALDVCVALVLPTGGSACGLTDPTGAAAEPTVHLVKVSASRAATVEFFFFDTDVTLAGALAARYERDTG